MKRSRLATKIGLVFFGFAFLLLISLGVAYWGHFGPHDVTAYYWVQIAFLISAFLLLITFGWITYRYVLLPLQELSNAARGIGYGDLEARIEVKGAREIVMLSAAMEDMRSKLLVSSETLEERVTQRTQELETLNAVSREIISGLEIKRILSSVVDKSRQLLGADAAFLCLLDDQRQLLHLQSNSGAVDAVVACDTTAEASWARQIITSEQAVRCGLDSCHGFCKIVAIPYRQSHLAAPLSTGDRAIGALCVASLQPNAFTPEATCYLTRLANIASIAMENARLYSQLERSSTFEERHRIATEMHDGLAQTLSYLRLTADQAFKLLDQGEVDLARQSLGRVQLGVDQASTDIRRAIESLEQQFPTQFTLQEQLSSLVDELNENTIGVEWDNQTHIPLILAQPDAEQALRVVREAVINAQKHSRATKISVKLMRLDGTAVISIEDNGAGFDPQDMPQDDRLHFGLKIMGARAARLGGNLEIHTQKDCGAQVVLTWPLDGDQKHA